MEHFDSSRILMGVQNKEIITVAHMIMWLVESVSHTRVFHTWSSDEDLCTKYYLVLLRFLLLLLFCMYDCETHAVARLETRELLSISLSLSFSLVDSPVRSSKSLLTAQLLFSGGKIHMWNFNQMKKCFKCVCVCVHCSPHWCAAQKHRSFYAQIIE